MGSGDCDATRCNVNSRQAGDNVIGTTTCEHYRCPGRHARSWRRRGQGVGQYGEQGIPLSGHRMVWQDEARKLHERSGGQGCRQPRRSRKGLPVDWLTTPTWGETEILHHRVNLGNMTPRAKIITPGEAYAEVKRCLRKAINPPRCDLVRSSFEAGPGGSAGPRMAAEARLR